LFLDIEISKLFNKKQESTMHRPGTTHFVLYVRDAGGRDDNDRLASEYAAEMNPLLCRLSSSRRALLCPVRIHHLGQGRVARIPEMTKRPSDGESGGQRTVADVTAALLFEGAPS
jgi:hypothetical protein